MQDVLSVPGLNAPGRIFYKKRNNSSQSVGTLLRATLECGVYEITGSTIEVLAPQSETFTLNLIVDIYPATTNADNYQRYSEVLTADGTDIKVRSWSYEEPSDSLTGTLNVQLANIAQRSLIDRDAVIVFSLREYNNTLVDWDATTLIDTGYLDRSQYQISRNGIGSADTFAFTALPILASRLNKAPATNTVYYNALRHTFTVADFEGVTSATTNVTTPPVVTSGSNDLYALLDLVYVTQCGFTSVKTNIPNFDLGVVEFPVGRPYVQTINGLIGMFSADYSIDSSNNLWIRDGTSGIPSGFPAPRQVTVSNAQTIGVSANIQRIDALELSINQERLSWDTWEERVESTTEESGNGGAFSSDRVTTYIETIYRDYYRLSRPTVPVKTEIRQVTRTTYRRLVVPPIHRTIEVYQLDELGRVTSRTKTTYMLVTTFDTLANFDGTTDSMMRIAVETESITYLPHPFQASRYYIAVREMNKEGIVLIDSENQQLGEDYAQELEQVYKAGNAIDSMSVEWRKISTSKEEITPQRNERVQIQTTETNYLFAPSGNYNQKNEIRDGEVGTNIFVDEQQRLMLYTEGTTTINGIVQSINMGELPSAQAIALGKRILVNQNTLSNIVSFDLVGIDRSLVKGMPIQAVGRDNEDLGNYVIESRSMSGSQQGYFMQITCRQVD